MTPTPAPVVPSSSTVTTYGGVSSYTNTWWGEEDVTVTNQQAITAMTLVVSVAEYRRGHVLRANTTPTTRVSSR